MAVSVSWAGPLRLATANALFSPKNGADLLVKVLSILELRGIAADYAGLIDMRVGRQGDALRIGMYSIYEVPWSGRIWRQMTRLTPPDRETLGAVLASVAHRSIRSVLDFRKRGWRSKKFRNPARFKEVWLSYRCEYPSIRTPAYLYVCPKSVQRLTPGDPSVGTASTLQGGFVIRSIEGNHETCIQLP